MQVFKVFVRLLKHYKGLILLYTGIFLVVALVMSQNNGADEEPSEGFETVGANIVLIDQEKKTLGKAITSYFGKENTFTDMEYDKQAIQNELYWRAVDYVLVIPEGFEEGLCQGKEMELQCMKVPGYRLAEYIESEVNLYMSKLTALLKSGYSIEEAEQKIQSLQSKTVEVTMANFVNTKNSCSIFFLFAPYLFITLGMTVMGMIFLRLNAKEIKDRMECSALTMGTKVAGMLGGSFVYGLLLLAITVITGIMLSKGEILTDIRFPYFLFNLFAMLLFGMSLGFLTGNIAKNNEGITGMTNMISLALCFAGGIFVPQQYFSAGLIKIAKFFPTYWYVVANDAIAEMKEMTPELAKKIFPAMGVVVAYAIALFAVALVVIVNKRKQK